MIVGGFRRLQARLMSDADLAWFGFSGAGLAALIPPVLDHHSEVIFRLVALNQQGRVKLGEQVGWLTTSRSDGKRRPGLARPP